MADSDVFQIVFDIEINKEVCCFLLCFTVDKTYISLFVYIFHYSEKYNCYAELMLVIIEKHILTRGYATREKCFL